MRKKKKEGGGRELVVQSLPRLPHPRKTPRGGISCYLMPAKLSSKISLTTPDLLKTLSPQKLLYKQIKCMQCVLYVCCVLCGVLLQLWCVCTCTSRQAGRQVYGNNNSINHTRSNDVGFFYACFHPVQIKYLLVDLVALTTSDLRPPAQPQKISTSHAVGLKLLL